MTNPASFEPSAAVGVADTAARIPFVGFSTLLLSSNFRLSGRPTNS